MYGCRLRMLQLLHFYCRLSITIGEEVAFLCVCTRIEVYPHREIPGIVYILSRYAQSGLMLTIAFPSLKSMSNFEILYMLCNFVAIPGNSFGITVTDCFSLQCALLTLDPILEMHLRDMNVQLIYTSTSPSKGSLSCCALQSRKDVCLVH